MRSMMSIRRISWRRVGVLLALLFVFAPGCMFVSFSVFGPKKTDALSWLDAPGDDLSIEVLSEPRAAQSAKGFFLPAAELLGRYGADADAGGVAQATKLVLFGIRACELRARNYLDKVLSEGEFKDPAYIARREQTTVIATDCIDCTTH